MELPNRINEINKHVFYVLTKGNLFVLSKTQQLVL